MTTTLYRGVTVDLGSDKARYDAADAQGKARIVLNHLPSAGMHWSRSEEFAQDWATTFLNLAPADRVHAVLTADHPGPKHLQTDDRWLEDHGVPAADHWRAKLEQEETLLQGSPVQITAVSLWEPAGEVDGFTDEWDGEWLHVPTRMAKAAVWLDSPSAIPSTKYGEGYVARGLAFSEMPEAVGRKIVAGTVTARDILGALGNNVGVWWWSMSDGTTIEDPMTYAEGMGDQDYTLKGQYEEDPEQEWWEYGEVRLVIVAKSPKRNGEWWDPEKHNESNGLMGNSYLLDNERLEVVEIMYDAGWGWKALPAQGIQVKADQKTATYFMHDVNEPLIDTKPMVGFEEKASFDFVHPLIATGGAVRRASDMRILYRRGIRGVVSGRRDFDESVLLEGQNLPGMAVLILPTPDNGEGKPTSWFKAAIDFCMPYLHRGQGVYIHCHAGMNRGPSLAYAVLRAFTGMGHEEAYNHIKVVRPAALIAYAPDADKALVELGYAKAPAAVHVDKFHTLTGSKTASLPAANWSHGCSKRRYDEVVARGYFPADYRPRGAKYGHGVYLTTADASGWAKKAPASGDSVAAGAVLPIIPDVQDVVEFDATWDGEHDILAKRGWLEEYRAFSIAYSKANPYYDDEDFTLFGDFLASKGVDGLYLPHMGWLLVFDPTKAKVDRSRLAKTALPMRMQAPESYTIEPAMIDGRACFIVRQHGYLVAQVDSVEELAEIVPIDQLSEPRNNIAARKTAAYTTCENGHDHWGPYGAAGLLLTHTEDGVTRYLLQKRAEWVDQGGTWSTPGGALDPGENPIQAAKRECQEELHHVPDFTVLRTFEDTCGGWTYTTVIAEVSDQFATEVTHESQGTRWVTKEEARSLPLHPSLRKVWGQVTGSKTAGPNGGRIPQGVKARPPFGSDIHQPRPVKIDRLAGEDIEDLEPDERSMVLAALKRLERGTDRTIEAKRRPPLVGCFSLDVTGAMRVLFYLHRDGHWHVFAVLPNHDYGEAERRMRQVAGANGKRPVDMRIVKVHDGLIQARIPGRSKSDEKNIGYLRWDTYGGRIEMVWVDPKYQRRGIATEMLQVARDWDPTVHHSDDLSDEGQAWSQKVASLTTETYEGTVGDRTHITCNQRGTVPTSAIAHLMGKFGEVPGEHRNKKGRFWEGFKADIAANGIKEPIFITVDPGKEPRISEGNHRRDAAVELGLPEVPVVIRYFGCAEQTSKVARFERQQTVEVPVLLSGLKRVIGDWVLPGQGERKRGPGFAGETYFQEIKDDLAKKGRPDGPILVNYSGDDKKWYIEDGNHRAQAAVELGWKTIPAVVSWYESSPPTPKALSQLGIADVATRQVAASKTAAKVASTYTVFVGWGARTPGGSAGLTPDSHGRIVKVEADSDNEAILLASQMVNGGTGGNTNPIVTTLPDGMVTSTEILSMEAKKTAANGVFYHASPVLLEPGTVLRPATQSRFRWSRPDRVYFSHDVGNCLPHAGGYTKVFDGKAYVYQVEPLGDIEDDNEAAQRLPGASYMAPSAVVVKRLSLAEVDQALLSMEAKVASTDDWLPDKGMWTRGQETLDPRIFDGIEMKPEVRAVVLGILDRFWTSRYGDWRKWAHVYLCGSGASHWWDSDGDLDILIGLDLPALVAARPQNKGLDEAAICEHFNHELKTELDPTTAAYDFGPPKPMDVTFFVNPGSYPITKIHPYAAFDMTQDTWVVEPPVLPEDWSAASAPPWVIEHARDVAALARHVLSLPEPERTLEGTALFNRLHEWRQEAYSEGNGWLSFGNVVYQWLSQEGLLRPLYLCKHPEEIGKTAAPNRVKVFSGDGQTHYAYNDPYIVVGNTSKMSTRPMTPNEIKVKVPWDSDLRDSIRKAEQQAEHFYSQGDWPRWTKGHTFYLIAGSGNTSRAIGMTKRLGDAWQPVHGEVGYDQAWPELLRLLDRPKDAFAAFCMTIADAQPPGFNLHPLTMGKDVVTIYRGISLAEGMDPLASELPEERSSKGGIGSSWTLDLGVAKAIAERGMAGFSSDNNVFGKPHPIKVIPGKYGFDRSRAVVLRATVDLSQPGMGLLSDGRMYYASEQEVDVKPGTEITLTGYLEADKVVVDPRAKRKAEEQAKEDMAEKGFSFEKYDITYRWPTSWHNANIKRTAVLA